VANNTPLVFVSGWGCDASLWNAVAPAFPHHHLVVPFAEVPALPPRYLGVGCSMGVLWLLQHPERLTRLVSISGCTRFSGADDFPEGVPLSALKAMAKKLPRQTTQLLHDFYQAAGAPVAPPDISPIVLNNGLDFLETADYRRIPMPIHALHSRDDAIITPAHATACFNNIEWLETGIKKHAATSGGAG
jgi:pimeloyl-ACP methyl ester carboxylesterase